jgi:hypothetical protein
MKTYQIFEFFSSQAIACEANQVYEAYSKCPATCLFPLGKYDCGLLKNTKECHCKPGYVFNSAGKCVTQVQCGCKLPNGVDSIMPNSSLISADCTKMYTCDGVERQITELSLTPCSPNAICMISNATSSCKCNAGFYGDGFSCQKMKAFNETCVQSEECVAGFACVNSTCQCPSSDSFWSSLNSTCCKCLFIYN